MNPQSNQTPGLRLPQPSFDVGQASASVAPQAFQAPQMPAMQPQAAMPMPQAGIAPAVQQPAVPVATPAAVQVPPATQQTAMPQAPTTAPVQEAVQNDDEGALDQEWVTKAKEVVGRTHGDPYLESIELGKLKAQYIKVRYNKDISIVED